MPSIPTYGSFDPPESTADEDTLAAEAEALEANSGRIVGRGETLTGDMRGTAVDFSEIVSEPLRQEAGNSTAAYLAAMQGAAWGAMVTGKWAADVKTYKTRREELIEEWEEAVDDDFGVDRAALGAEIGEDSPSKSADAIDREVETAVAEAGQEKLTEMNGQAGTAWEEYKENASEAGRMLTAGPNAEDLRVLTGGGAASWLPFNLWGTDASIPVTGSDGRDLGEALHEAMRNGDELTPELRAQLEMVYAIADRAQDSQGIDGAELSADELEFLEEFYAYMDNIDGGERDVDVHRYYNPLYHVAEWAEDSETMSAEDRNLLLTALGGGILALSNERVGGGYDRLPDTMRSALEGADSDFDIVGASNMAVLDGLSPLFGGVLGDPYLASLEGGRDFSAALTGAVADGTYLNGAQNVYDSGEFSNLLGVSTRNHEANADILSGDWQIPKYGDDTAEFVTRGLFGFDWEDGGAAAAGLIDWIDAETLSDDPDQNERAARAAYGLFTTLTGRDVSEHWNESAYDFFTDGYGEIGGVPAASLGMANPEIARALGDVTISYIPMFGEDAPDGKPNEFMWDDPDSPAFYLDEDTRAGIFELVMADNEAADTLGGRVYALVLADAETMHTWDGLSYGENIAGEHGRLIGLLDAGYARLVADGEEGAGATTASENSHAAWASMGAAILKEAGGELYSKIPGLETLGTGGKIFIKEILEVPKWGVPLGQAEGWWWDGTAGSPDTQDVVQRYEEVNFNISHSVVKGMIEDPETGVTIDDVVRAAEARDVEPEDIVDGDRLVDPGQALGDIGYSDIAQVYHDIMEEHGVYDDYRNFRDVINPQSDDVAAENGN